MPTHTARERVESLLIAFIADVSLVRNRPDFDALPMEMRLNLSLAFKKAALAFDMLPKEAS